MKKLVRIVGLSALLVFNISCTAQDWGNFAAGALIGVAVIGSQPRPVYYIPAPFHPPTCWREYNGSITCF